VITAPSTPIITLRHAQLQCRILTAVTDEDSLLTDLLVPAAEERAETDTNRQLLTAVYDLKLRGFPCDFIDVPRPPLVSVGSIKYLDTAGIEQTLATTEYVVSAPAGRRCARGRIELAYGKTWPSTLDQMNAVTVRFTAGYGAAASVPAMLKGAMLLDLGTLYAHREEFLAGVTIEKLPRVDAIYSSFRSYPPKRAAA